MRRSCYLAVVALLIATGGACSSSSPKAASSSSGGTTASSASTASASNSASTPSSPDDLAALLITAAPDGFVLQPDTVGDTGPSDLAKAVRDEGTPTAEASLRAEGFVQGYQRLFMDSTKAQIIVFVYQFTTEAGARQDWTRSNDLVASQAPSGFTAFTVDGLPADSTTALQGATATRGAAVVDFATGVFNVRVVCNATTTDGLQARVSALAADQFSRL